MRLPLHDSSSRRAILTALAAALPMPLLPLPSVADGRTVAQSVGIDNKETLSGAVGIIWGGRERCDPTDDTFHLLKGFPSVCSPRTFGRRSQMLQCSR